MKTIPKQAHERPVSLWLRAHCRQPSGKCSLTADAGARHSHWSGHGAGGHRRRSPDTRSLQVGVWGAPPRRKAGRFFKGWPYIHPVTGPTPRYLPKSNKNVRSHGLVQARATPAQKSSKRTMAEQQQRWHRDPAWEWKGRNLWHLRWQRLVPNVTLKEAGCGDTCCIASCTWNSAIGNLTQRDRSQSSAAWGGMAAPPGAWGTFWVPFRYAVIKLNEQYV